MLLNKRRIEEMNKSNCNEMGCEIEGIERTGRAGGEEKQSKGNEAQAQGIYMYIHISKYHSI